MLPALEAILSEFGRRGPDRGQLRGDMREAAPLAGRV